MSNFLMLVVCLAAGLALRASGRLPDNAHATLNGVIVHLALPAVTLHYLHGFDFEAAHVLPVLMPWALFIIGAALFWAVGRKLHLPAATVGAMTLVGGLGNTSFVGLPMIAALQGEDGLPVGLVIDQMGSYLALSTLGIAIASASAADGRVTAREMARKVASFPPFIALVVALLLSRVAFPPVLDATLAHIGATLAPLALLSVGLQLRFDALREHARLLCIGLGFKLLVCPALVVGVLWAFSAAPSMTSRVSVIEAAMPPMIGAAVIAAQAKLAPRLVSMMVGIGIPLGMLTAPLWLWLFGLAAA